MSHRQILDADKLLARVAERTPDELRANVVVVGSIASAWAFRDVSGTGSVATKDIDLLLRPAVDAVATAESLGRQLLEDGWEPQYPNGMQPGAPGTPEDQLPALRLSPPDAAEGWFVELLGAPLANQGTRKHWRRIQTGSGDFGLPSFRYMSVAVHGAASTELGLRVARPSSMALAHLLEHADPDLTPISNLRGTPPRFTKDVGRAVALWWLARRQTPRAGEVWGAEWAEALWALYPDRLDEMKRAARAGLAALGNHLRPAHAIAVAGVLAPHNTSFEAFSRAYATLLELIDALPEAGTAAPGADN